MNKRSGKKCVVDTGGRIIRVKNALAKDLVRNQGYEYVPKEDLRTQGKKEQEPTTDAVKILHKRYIKTPERRASLARERFVATIRREVREAKRDRESAATQHNIEVDRQQKNPRNWGENPGPIGNELDL